MRMLDELEAVVRPRSVEQSAAPSNWLLALLALGVALGASLWWTKHRGTEAAAPVAVASERVVAAPAIENAAPASAPAAASAPARIESVSAAAPADASVPADANLAPAPVPAVPARVAARPAAASARPAAPQPAGVKVTTVTTASGGKWTVTVAEAGADKPLPGPASAVAARRMAPATESTKVDDADVRLLSALLAHVARPSQGIALADEDQVTIAQLVRRCDTRPAAEVRDCRRRICEGYWGKAEACPAAAAKKG